MTSLTGTVCSKLAITDRKDHITPQPQCRHTTLWKKYFGKPIPPCSVFWGTMLLKNELAREQTHVRQQF